MAIFSDRDRKRIRELLGELESPVTLVNFTQELECPTCRDTRTLVEEVGELSDKLRVEVYNFVTDKDKVELYGVDKIPATVVLGGQDRGIRFFGMPAGYELATLLQDIKMVSSGDSGLSPASRSRLRGLTTPLHLQVFVTPT